MLGSPLCCFPWPGCRLVMSYSMQGVALGSRLIAVQNKLTGTEREVQTLEKRSHSYFMCMRQHACMRQSQARHRSCCPSAWVQEAYAAVPLLPPVAASSLSMMACSAGALLPLLPPSNTERPSSPARLRAGSNGTLPRNGT